MWILVFWVCTAGMCDTNIVPGVYQTADICEKAKTELLEAKGVLFEVGARSGACITAPDYVTYE